MHSKANKEKDNKKKIKHSTKLSHEGMCKKYFVRNPTNKNF